jgi:hypothetical protein
MGLFFLGLVWRAIRPFCEIVVLLSLTISTGSSSRHISGLIVPSPFFFRVLVFFAYSFLDLLILGRGASYCIMPGMEISFCHFLSLVLRHLRIDFRRGLPRCLPSFRNVISSNEGFGCSFNRRHLVCPGPFWRSRVTPFSFL